MPLRAYSKLRRVRYRDGRYIMISSMPKSGSSFLTRALAAATGYRHSYLAYEYGNLEQELYLPKVVDAYGVGTVTQQHFKANQANLSLMKTFGIRPIVLVRNLFDIIVSLRDHLMNENMSNLPGLEVDPNFRQQELSRQIDFVVDLCVPWYLGYYVSWCQAEAASAIDFHWLQYEQAIRDWPSCVRRVLTFCSLSTAAERAEQSVQQALSMNRSEIRLNRGISGRGAVTLSQAQRERVRQLARYYPTTDFSRIGLGPSGGTSGSPS